MSILKSVWLISYVLIFGCLIASNSSFGFPANSRYGYSNCQTCHVSPTGGGVVTKYGKMTSEEFMSTWAYEGEASPTYGLFDLPVWLDIGGDVRQVEIKSEIEGLDPYQIKFIMQFDVEVALHFTRRLSLVTSGGRYGGAYKWERRRTYALLEVSKGLKFRFGQFFPAYGIMIDDHTKLFRRNLGFDQGRESVNAEVSYNGVWGDLIVTRIFGNKPSFESKDDGGLGVKNGDDDGGTIRAAKYFTKRFQLGLSYLRDRTRRSLGAYMIWGMSKSSYWLMQMDRLRKTDGEYIDVLFNRFGFEIFRGFQIKTEYQYLRSENSKTNVIGGALQWFPRPHWEFLMQQDLVRTDGNKITNSLVMVHYYF
jgi:hypothetical protein